MKRMLRKQKAELYYYERDIKKMGAHANVTGNISGKIEGDIDLCEITDGERRKGIDIEDLILAD